MRYICTLCERFSPDTNLTCTRIDCPGAPVYIFGGGQMVGDVEVVKRRLVTRSAIYYDGLQGGDPVLLKVAHRGTGERLSDEARLLRALTLRQSVQKDKPELQEMAMDAIPVLLPAYKNDTLSDAPFGRATINGDIFYYIVMEPLDGISLREYLQGNPQPWYKHAIFVVMQIALAVNLMHKSYYVLHLQLTPDAILIRTDKEGILRATLIDFGLATTYLKGKGGKQVIEIPVSAENLRWLYLYGYPAYTAPELTLQSRDSNRQYDISSPVQDVYGLGLLLHEMLSGQPRFSYTNQLDDSVRRNVLTGNSNPLNRTDLKNYDIYNKLVNECIERNPESRGRESAYAVYDKLKRTVNEDIPPLKKESRISQVIWRAALAIGIVVGVVVLTGITITAPA